MQQVADKMNFQDPVQKYAECHSWDMSNSNATKYHEIKVGILDNTCFKENVPTFEILVGWILRLGLNFWVINVALYSWKCDPVYLGAASEKALLAADQSNLDEKLGWAMVGGIKCRTKSSLHKIENMVTNNKINKIVRAVHVHSGIWFVVNKVKF